MAVSGLSKYVDIPTFSIIFAKPGHMADTLLILALPSSRSLWLFPISIPSLSLNCQSRTWDYQDLVRPFTPRLLMDAPEAGWMICARHGMWFLKAGHSIPEASRVDSNARVIKSFEEALSAVIPIKWPVVRSIRSRISFKCSATCAPVW
jgi:hypothetical protein